MGISQGIEGDSMHRMEWCLHSRMKWDVAAGWRRMGVNVMLWGNLLQLSPESSTDVTLVCIGSPARWLSTPNGEECKDWVRSSQRNEICLYTLRDSLELCLTVFVRSFNEGENRQKCRCTLSLILLWRFCGREGHDVRRGALPVDIWVQFLHQALTVSSRVEECTSFMSEITRRKAPQSADTAISQFKLPTQF